MTLEGDAPWWQADLEKEYLVKKIAIKSIGTLVCLCLSKPCRKRKYALVFPIGIFAGANFKYIEDFIATRWTGPRMKSGLLLTFMVVL